MSLHWHHFQLLLIEIRNHVWTPGAHGCFPASPAEAHTQPDKKGLQIIEITLLQVIVRVVLPPLGHPTTSTAQPQLPGRMFGLVLYQPITNGLVMLISLCLAKYLRTRTVLFLPHLTVSIFSHTEYLQVVIIRIKGESNCKTITQSMSLGRHLPCVGHPPPLACHRPIHEADVTHWASKPRSTGSLMPFLHAGHQWKEESWHLAVLSNHC